MGKPKTQRTIQLIEQGIRYEYAEQASNAIEQHNFDRLVRTGLIVEEGGLSSKVPKPPEGHGLL